MRKRLIHGLDSLFRHYVWLCLSPLAGYGIACAIARLVWGEIPLAGFVAGLTGGLVGTVLGLLLMRVMKACFHPWVIAQLASMKEDTNA